MTKTIDIDLCGDCVKNEVCKFKVERKALVDNIKSISEVNNPDSPFPVSVGCKHLLTNFLRGL